MDTRFHNTEIQSLFSIVLLGWHIMTRIQSLFYFIWFGLFDFIIISLISDYITNKYSTKDYIQFYISIVIFKS